jgi:hypothetical protein
VSAVGNAITLTTGANNFVGAVATTGTAVQLTDTNAIDLGATSASSLAVIAGGAVTQSGALAVTGTTSVSAVGNAITLASANVFGGAVSLTGGTTQITDAAALTLGTLNTGSLTANSAGALGLGQGTVTGNLVASSGGNAITQSGPLTVTGTAGITAGAAPITLTSANDFQGVVTLSNSGAANAVSITDVNSIEFASMNLGGSFTVTSGAGQISLHDLNAGAQLINGNVLFNSTYTTNGGAFTVNGRTTLGSSSIIITQGGLVFLVGPVGGDADPAIETLTINAGSGAITMNNAGNSLTGTLTLTGGTTRVANSVGLTLGTLRTGALTVNTTGGPLILGQGSVGGALIATSGGGAITQSGPLTVTGPGSSINAGTGSMTLSSVLLLGQISLSGRTGILSSADNVIDQNILTNFSGSLTLTGAAANWNLAGGSTAGSFLTTSNGINVQVQGATQVASLASVTIGNTISAAQGAATAAAADEASKTFGTDSVAEQVEFGFAGDVGALPPMDHRLQGVGISVPKCFNESREGEGC